MQHAPQISLKLTGGNRDGHWGNLQFVLWRVPLRRWKRGARKYTQEKEQAILWPPWKNCDISRKEMWRHTSKKKQILKTQVQELHETGGTLTGWEEFSFGISALFSLILARVEQTLKWVWIKSGLTDRKPFSYTKSNTWLCNFLTVPAVPLGHFAHPGLGDGGTGYCVLGWFLYNVPRSSLQTPLKATGFVSPGAGSPFAPLTHLAALCRERQKKVMCRETTALLGVNTDTPGSRLMQAEGAFTWMP